MKGIVLLANGFEDIEALATIDLLKRANIEVETVSVENTIEIKTQYNLCIKADKLYSEIKLEDYNFVILPGGKAVVETHLNSTITKQTITHFINNHQLVCAICAAPSVLGVLGYLKNKPYTCFPGFEEYIVDGINKTNEKVVVTDNIITSKAAGASFLFAYEIIKYLKDEAVANDVLNKIYY